MNELSVSMWLKILGFVGTVVATMISFIVAAVWWKVKKRINILVVSKKECQLHRDKLLLGDEEMNAKLLSHSKKLDVFNEKLSETTVAISEMGSMVSGLKELIDVHVSYLKEIIEHKEK